MGKQLRIAFFPDTYDEVDGVANTSRQFEAFARKCQLDFLVVCGGNKDRIEQDGSVTRITCRRGSIGFSLDKKHDFDLAFWRHYQKVFDAVREFSPDILHITGPSDVGQLGALVAHRLHVPLAASWHTNLHQYAEQRASGLLRLLPRGLRQAAAEAIRDSCLLAILRFYRIAQILFAPNPELIHLLARSTQKPVYSMKRGVDTSLFSPKKRERAKRELTIGYVGRLTVEKNVAFLAELEDKLEQYGFSRYRFSIVGQGAEEEWLRSRMRKADFHGVLSGEPLARAYANMDVFVFPSRTDTFGNVVLEALASGVPAIVTDAGGPQFIIQPGESGFVGRNSEEFACHIRKLSLQPELLSAMRRRARNHALIYSWESIFSGMYEDYRHELQKRAIMGKSLSADADSRVASAGTN